MIYNLLNRLKRELYIDLTFVKEIFMEIAVKTSAKVGSIKRSIEAASLDSRIDKEYEKFGEKIYNLLIEYKDFSGDPEINDSVNRIRQLKLALLKLEEDMAYFSDDVLISRVMNLKDDLKMGSLMLETITLSGDSPLLKTRINDLKLSSGLRIVFVKRSGKFLIPDGMTELMAGDSITVIGNRSNANNIMKLFK